MNPAATQQLRCPHCQGHLTPPPSPPTRWQKTWLRLAIFNNGGELTPYVTQQEIYRDATQRVRVILPLIILLMVAIAISIAQKDASCAIGATLWFVSVVFAYQIKYTAGYF